MTKEKVIEEADIHIIVSARNNGDINGAAKDLTSPRTTKNRRILGNLGAWRYGKYVPKVNQKVPTYI